jgi:hypothetical protein
MQCPEVTVASKNHIGRTSNTWKDKPIQNISPYNNPIDLRHDITKLYNDARFLLFMDWD